MKFVKESYDEHNEWAIQKVSDYLVYRGYEILPKQEEDYSLDILATKDNEFIYVEAEVKEDYPWTDLDSFKFPTVSFLARKKKWKNVGFWYVIVCKETEAMLVGHSDVIFNDQYLEILNIRKGQRHGGDAFYRVPKELLIFITKEEDGYGVSYRP